MSKLLKWRMDSGSGDLQVGSFAPHAAELAATDELMLPKCMGLGEAGVATHWRGEVAKLCQSVGGARGGDY